MAQASCQFPGALLPRPCMHAQRQGELTHSLWQPQHSHSGAPGHLLARTCMHGAQLHHQSLRCGHCWHGQARSSAMAGDASSSSSSRSENPPRESKTSRDSSSSGSSPGEAANDARQANNLSIVCLYQGPSCISKRLVCMLIPASLQKCGWAGLI